MDSFDSSFANKMLADGYITSPPDALILEKQCRENIRDWKARWKLLGFYYAHQMCCPQYQDRRIENVIWIIENVPQGWSNMRSCLLPGPGDRSYVRRIRVAWQHRINAAPNDPVSYDNMGHFLRAVNPDEACPYYEKALLLGGDKSIESSIITAKLLARHDSDVTSEDYGQITCFFDVLQAGDQLLQGTRNRMQPNEVDWNRFLNIAHELIWNPDLLAFAQFGGEEPNDASAETICKSALRQLYERLEAHSEMGRALREPKLNLLWNDLIMS